MILCFIIYKLIRQYEATVQKMKHFLSVFLNANNKVALAHYHWTLNLEIIGHTEVIIKY